MLITEAHIRTDRPSRYLTQLCKHPRETGGHMRRWADLHHNGKAPPQIQPVEWSDTHGSIDLGWGRCTLQAGPDSLTLRVEAADQDSLQRIQHLIAGRLQKIGKRDALQVTWQKAGAADHQLDDPATAAPAPAEKAVSRPRSRAALGLIAVIALVVAVHLGLGGLLLASGPGTHRVIGAVLAIILLHVLGSLAMRRSKAGKPR
ncbi:DUF2218 domain-containing protein [Streptomyces chiangmaiensis]|uniref:DUF2218 domain-containing protein n=1 Tax=Streptomyces chiangmaiensis TaxID=766497 RepID=A0ABU7FMQ8_9ACTN|nr:DUF2218 domain-containing protein [Streptomyces chiangmaiensis]MED7825410.1 DUF2218 domain-containing protein [Streptomyces chiangmaiensis]